MPARRSDPHASNPSPGGRGRRRGGLWLALGGAAVAVGGCERPAPPGPVAAAPAPAAEGGDPVPEPADDRALAPFTDPAGRCWLTKTIPYDAFATADAAPAAIGSAPAPTRRPSGDLLAGIGAGSVRSDVPTGGGMGGGGMSGGGFAGGGGDESFSAEDDPEGWAPVISAEDLRDEIARARNVLAAAVATVAAFNREADALPVEAATLAAMAEITAAHPGRVPWKDYAPAVRTLAVRVGEAAGARGRAARDAARQAFDPLDSVLGGNPPPDDAIAEFDRVVDAPRGELMARMQTALEGLQQDAPDADALARGGDDLARGAAVLAALAKFTAHPDYPSAEEEDYRKWSAELTAAASDAARLARDQPDYDLYRTAVGRAAATCTECHAVYR